MRRIASLICVLAIASSLEAAAAPAQDRFRGAERLGESALRQLIPGMRAVYVAGPDRLRYRGIVYEQYQTRPGRHAISLGPRGGFNALRIGYPETLHMGSYRIRGDALCSILIREAEEHCRGVFRLPDGGYALSTYEDPNTPSVRIQFEPIR